MSFVDELRKEVEAAPIESELIGGYTFPSGKGVHPPGSVEDRLHKIEFALGALRRD